MNYLHTATKLILGYAFLFLSTKMIGKQQISQTSLFDFISAMVLGEIIGNALYNHQLSFWYVLMNLIIWVFLKYITEKIILKSVKLRSLLDGKPSILIHNGEIDQKQLKKNNLSIHQFSMMMRESGIFSINEVQYALLENNGQLSIMKKPEYQNPTIQDLNLPVKSQSLPIIMIADGEILKENLTTYKVNESWLKKELEKKGYQIKEVIYAEMTEDQKITIITTNNKV
ncbi:MAG: DUF421 domain-containing protein [Halanaerobiales bacterium]|nr:DUF421 domain-containing protein [Halanaerobiales bacterium]